ncbi:MAG: serine/threonine-protein kinase [Myxococcaceae bacterium]
MSLREGTAFVARSSDSDDTEEIPREQRSTRRARMFGDYEIISLLGRGGMSEVYKARALAGRRAGQLVAIKRLIPELTRDANCVKLFDSEAKLSRMLRHANIIDVYEEGIFGGVHFIAMELIDGRDLAHILRRCKDHRIQLPIDFALFLGHALLEALSSAHTAVTPSNQPLGLVHCDVSPSNLFISRTGEIKLGDFGVARGRLIHLDIPQYVAGKPFYVSPEVLDGEIAPAGDLWAAAVTLYELLTLERPFEGQATEEIYKKIRKRKYRKVREVRPEISPGLEAVLERALAKDRKVRYQTAAEFAEAIRPHLDERVGTPLAIAAVVRGLFGGRDI